MDPRVERLFTPCRCGALGYQHEGDDGPGPRGCPEFRPDLSRYPMGLGPVTS